MTKQPTPCVVLTADPHTTAHFWKVASELFRGSFVECERYIEEKGSVCLYIWRAEFWDKGQDK